MSGILESNVMEEVVPLHQEQAQLHQEESAIQDSTEILKEDVQDKNWKQARQKMDEQSQQIRLLNQELELIRKYQAPKHKEPEIDETENFTDSERKLYNELKELKTHIKQTRAKEEDYVLDRLKSKHTDFEEVVHPENVNYLKQNNPALAKALASLKDDPYEQGLAAYEALKNTEWFKQRNTMEDKAKLEQNQKKPVSVQAVRKQGALSEANRFVNGLTPELKKALQQEMEQARKGA